MVCVCVCVRIPTYIHKIIYICIYVYIYVYTRYYAEHFTSISSFNPYSNFASCFYYHPYIIDEKLIHREVNIAYLQPHI